LVPETPWTVIVVLPMGAVALAVKINVTFKAFVAGTCTGLEGANPTVIPDGEVALRDTASPLAAKPCEIVRITTSV